MSNVAVLISTYNGRLHIQEQLDSVLSQENAKVSLLVRDDGSTDETLDILHTYEQDEGVKVAQGLNIGPAASFMTLLYGCGDFDYYAFCDQDDVWRPRKLAQAIQWLEEQGERVPALYCGRLEYVSGNLQPLGYSTIPRRVGFHNALVQNAATGCTIVFNHAAAERIRSQRPSAIFMHDWWCYLVTAAFGTVRFDPESFILYRQHGQNVVGGTASVGKDLARRGLRHIRDRRQVRRTMQAREFQRLYYTELSPEQRKAIELFVGASSGIRGRLRYLAQREIWCNTALDEVLLRLMILVGRLH